VRAKGYTQAQLVDILDEYQPSVSNLIKGRISQVSIEKLLRYGRPAKFADEHRSTTDRGAKPAV